MTNLPNINGEFEIYPKVISLLDVNSFFGAVPLKSAIAWVKMISMKVASKIQEISNSLNTLNVINGN